MTEKPFIVIITGHPGTGKTSIGKGLSKEIDIPLISKDELKDRIFNTLGYSDKEWSLKVSAAAHRIMDYVVDEELRSGHSLILESNFKTEIDSERFAKLKDKYGCKLIQILVTADGSVIFKRFIDKMHGPERNPGHVEAIDEEAIRLGFLEPYPPLDIGGEVIKIDTTDFKKVDVQKIATELEKVLSKA